MDGEDNGAEAPRPPRPRLDSSGKRDPLFGHIVGRAFRMGCAAETVSQNIGPEWDAVSESVLKRKPHPRKLGDCEQKPDRDLARIELA